MLQEILRAKRDGETLRDEQIGELVAAVVDGSASCKGVL